MPRVLNGDRGFGGDGEMGERNGMGWMDTRPGLPIIGFNPNQCQEWMNRGGHPYESHALGL